MWIFVLAWTLQHSYVPSLDQRSLQLKIRGSGFLLLFPSPKFRLTEASVGFLLQSALGGYAAHFCPLEVQDWIYKFRVSSKSVGLFIYQKSFFQSAGFHVVF